MHGVLGCMLGCVIELIYKAAEWQPSALMGFPPSACRDMSRAATLRDATSLSGKKVNYMDE